jgi:hypothetical protein
VGARTICSCPNVPLALANLVMWTRDHSFPATYAHGTWEELSPFFKHVGLVRSSQQIVSVELRPENSRQYNRELVALCRRVNESRPHLPDERLLQFSVRDTCCPALAFAEEIGDSTGGQGDNVLSTKTSRSGL